MNGPNLRDFIGFEVSFGAAREKGGVVCGNRKNDQHDLQPAQEALYGGAGISGDQRFPGEYTGLHFGGGHEAQGLPEGYREGVRTAAAHRIGGT